MASTLNYPYFPIPPPPSPAHPIYPPPPHVIPPPPPPHEAPPPPLTPHVMPPPPPFHPIIPPPPHVLPPSPDNGPTVIIVVFISLGCIFFLALCFFALWCLIKKRKKTVQETGIIRVDEHLKVKEAIVKGPHGTQTVVLSIEEDKHIEEEIIKNEKLGKNHLHAKSGEITNSTTADLEAGESSTNPNTHHHLEYKP